MSTTSRGSTVKRPIINPSAGDILSGSDTELRQMATRVKRAERAANRQTAKAHELARRLSDSEASQMLRAENDRLRKNLADYCLIISAYASGNHVLGDDLAKIALPTASRFAERTLHDPQSVIRSMSEHYSRRRRYIYDAHGHRVRRDMVDANNECSECKRENMRLRNSA